MRLNKRVAASGFYSRREADALIAAGEVVVDGKQVQEAGYQLAKPESAVVVVKGRRLPPLKDRYTYVLLNKPTGVITSRRDEKDRKTVYDILPERYRPLKPVGRLDRNSCGLLLLTNDGLMHYRLTHPSFHLPKVYRVTVSPEVPNGRELARQLLEGVPLEPEQVTAKAAEVYQINATTFGLSLTTGYNRQIRRMLAHCGYEVTSLKRMALGPLVLSGMKPGDCRPLTAKEIQALRQAVGLGQPSSNSKGQPSSAKSRKANAYTAQTHHHVKATGRHSSAQGVQAAGGGNPFFSLGGPLNKPAKGSFKSQPVNKPPSSKPQSAATTKTTSSRTTKKPTFRKPKP